MTQHNVCAKAKVMLFNDVVCSEVKYKLIHYRTLSYHHTCTLSYIIIPVHYTAPKQSQAEEGWTRVFEHLQLPMD